MCPRLPPAYRGPDRAGGQLLREPRPFPTLEIAPEITDIDAFRFDHFKVCDYNPHGKIDMTMAV